MSTSEMAMAVLAVVSDWGLIGCLLAGGASGTLVWWIQQALVLNDTNDADEWRYDVSRMDALRRVDLLYRLFHPIIRVFGRMNRAAFPQQLYEMEREIHIAGLSRYWLAEEYLGRWELIALFMLPMYVAIGVTYLGVQGAFLGLFLTALTVVLLRYRLRRQARERLLAIKRRLPFLLDLLTLLMEAGAGFLQSLGQAVKEFTGHEVAVEFGRVLSDIQLGKSRPEAFESLRKRLGDDEIGNIVSAIQQSEQLGTPLAEILRTQADVLRLKRSQRAEAMAGEAGVNMLLPGVLVMAATVLIILGPFVLNYFYLGFGF